MNPILLLILLALAVIALSVMVFVLLKISARGRKAPETWPEVAGRLGLEPKDLPAADGTMTGRCLGFEVEVSVETPSKESRRLLAKVSLSSPLEIGLGLGPKTTHDAPADGGPSPFVTGNPAIDRALEPRALDTRGARRLFERKALRDRLAAVIARWTIVIIDDESVTLGGEHPFLDPAPVGALLDDASAVARLLDEDRPRMKNG